ncbi:MFS transporter [Brevibacillus sp. H7]|jgi:MFS family permease|uniref:MFS transporter n=1 Tax=Brevibacillus sp. H7 TaxID=3349138 RepID=UPI003810BA69
MRKNGFAYLWSGQTLANLGDVLYIVGMISAVYAATRSAAYTSIVPLVFVAAQTVSSFLAPLILDRIRLTLLLIVSQAGKTVILLILTWFVASVPSSQTVPYVFAFVAALAFLDGWANPARNALVPRLVAESELVKANGWLATTDQCVQFGGWAAGGLLVTLLGSVNVLWGSFALYLGAVVAMLGIPRVERLRQPFSDGHTLLEGWKAIWEKPFLRRLLFMEVIEGLAGAVWMAAILLPYVENVLQKGEEWWGYINASYMLGAILGGMLVLTYAREIQAYLSRSIFVGTMGAALVTFSFGWGNDPFLALLLSAVLGPFSQLQQTAKQTALQQGIDETVLPKAFSAKGTLDSVVFGVSVLAVGALADQFDIRLVYWLAAALIGFSALLVLLPRK